MVVRQLRLAGFRALSHQTLSFSPNLNLVFGENASGKTSLVEALDLASRGRSFRCQQLSEIANWQGDGRWAVDLMQAGPNEHLPLQLRFVEGGLAVRRNGESVNREHQAKALPALILGPDLHRLTDDGPKIRRAFLDWALFHVEQSFAQHWRRFQQALRQRNAAIRRRAKKSEIMAWNASLLSNGAVISSLRDRFVDDLKVHFKRLVNDVTLLPNVELAYRQGWAKGQSFEEALNQTDARAEILSVTPVGPHRADLDLLAEPGRVQAALSRGQQKVFLIGLGIALAELVHQRVGVWPMLAIDDWHAELSERTAETVFNTLLDYPGQRVITGFAFQAGQHAEAKMFHVEQGEFREC